MQHLQVQAPPIMFMYDVNLTDYYTVVMMDKSYGVLHFAMGDISGKDLMTGVYGAQGMNAMYLTVFVCMQLIWLGVFVL